jgi:hypothetical protein
LNQHRRSKPAPTDAKLAGAGRAWSPSPGYLVIALALAAGAIAFLFFLLMSSLSSNDVADDAKMPAPLPVASSSADAVKPLPASNPSQNAQQDMSPRAPEGDADPTRDLKSYVMRGEKPTMPEVIERLHQAGVHTGLGAFPPPGTRPPMVGLAVPEDFVLPKGYVRHHQATDDGQRIEAILMFAPDYQLFDANKQAIDMPKNRLVPPELAPPGFPIRRIVIPAPVEPASANH